jgi:hypothetical protein
MSERKSTPSTPTVNRNQEPAHCGFSLGVQSSETLKADGTVGCASAISPTPTGFYFAPTARDSRTLNHAKSSGNPDDSGLFDQSDTSVLDCPEPPHSDQTKPTAHRGFLVERPSRRKPLVDLTCAHCGGAFTLQKKRIRGGRGRFCSPKCSQLAKVGKPSPGFTTPESDKRQRIAANGLVNKRLKLGWFEKPTRCMKCGAVKRLDSHHTDYAAPDRVYWLCRSCHMQEHHTPGTLTGIAPFICDRRPASAKGVSK